MQASYQMLDLLEQTRDVIDCAVKAHQSKVAHGLEAQVPFHGARAQILAVDKQIAAVKANHRNARISACIDWRRSQRYAGDQTGGITASQTGIPATLSYGVARQTPNLQTMRWYVQASLDQVDSARALFYRALISKRFRLDSIHWIPYSKKTSRQFSFIRV